jgi:hypothetical protein
MTNDVELPGLAAQAPHVILPLSAVATDRRLRISVSPARSARPIVMRVREPDGTAWRVLAVSVDGIERWYGDLRYPVCRGNCWIDLEVECPHDHPPTVAKPTELRGVVVCEESGMPVGAGDTERDRQWAADFRKPRGAHKAASGEWKTIFRGDATPLPPPIAWEDSELVQEPRCRTCDGVMQENTDHVGTCSRNCFGTFVHAQPVLRPCSFAAHSSGHGAVVYVPRLVQRSS